MMEQRKNRLFCFDIAIDNIVLVDDFSRNLNVSLFFRLLSFEAQPLEENFSFDNSSTVQLGKSCLFQQDHESLIENLSDGYLILFLCLSENPLYLLASYKIPLSAAGSFFKSKSSSNSESLRG